MKQMKLQMTPMRVVSWWNFADGGGLDWVRKRWSCKREGLIMMVIATNNTIVIIMMNIMTAMNMMMMTTPWCCAVGVEKGAEEGAECRWACGIVILVMIIIDHVRNHHCDLIMIMMITMLVVGDLDND